MSQLFLGFWNKRQDGGRLWEVGAHIQCEYGQPPIWSMMSHKSSSIFSGVAPQTTPPPPPSPSHSHVYLPVIHALEQRSLMPCLWYMTHHVTRFIQWINPKKKRKKKPAAVTSLKHSQFLYFVFVLVDIVAYWVLWLIWFTSEVLSDLCRTLLCVVWCVSHLMSYPQVILYLIPIGGYLII